MKRFYMRHIRKSKKIIGIILGMMGFFIIVKFIPRELIVFILGVSFLIMGGLILKIK